MRQKYNKVLLEKASGVLTFVLLFSIFFTASCAKKQTIRATEIEPYEGPINTEVLKKHIGFGNIKSIKSLVDVTVFRKGESAGSFNGAFAYKLPGSMKVSLFGTFGLTIMEVLLSRDILQAYIPSQNILYEWQSPGISFSSFTDDEFEYRMEEKNNRYVLQAIREKNSVLAVEAEYIFDKTYVLNRSIIFYKYGEEIIRIDFEDFKGRVPDRTRMLFSNGSAMEISMKDPEFGADIPDKYFNPVEYGDKKVLPLQDMLNRFDSIR